MIPVIEKLRGYIDEWNCHSKVSTQAIQLSNKEFNDLKNYLIENYISSLALEINGRKDWLKDGCQSKYKGWKHSTDNSIDSLFSSTPNFIIYGFKIYIDIL